MVKKLLDACEDRYVSQGAKVAAMVCPQKGGARVFAKHGISLRASRPSLVTAHPSEQDPPEWVHGLVPGVAVG
jgi:hypothetical protein